MSGPAERPLQVTLLSSEWRSTKGGLSTINRELAIQLANFPDVQVSVYLPEYSEEDKQVAEGHNVNLIQAKKLVGYDAPDWLVVTPEGHSMDCVIGHGVLLGKQVQIIKRLNEKCKWIQVVHTDPEELGMLKHYDGSIAKGEKKHDNEKELCKLADHVVAIGPKLLETSSGYLRPVGKDQHVLNLTPGVFSEFADVTQAAGERKTFSVLVFGRGDSEDFKLKGYDIAAKAIAQLKDMSQPYKLKFVGAPSGEEEQVKEMLLEQGITHDQLTVRSFKEREQLTELFSEVDLNMMPSRTEGFGLAALEALSAGLPVLVSGNSGLGEALKQVPYGSNWVVDSEDPKEWAKAIRKIREKKRDLRLEETKSLREAYANVYSWEQQCKVLVETMALTKFETTRYPGISSGNLKRQGSLFSDCSAPKRFKPTCEATSGKVSKKDLQRLCTKISNKWKRLARCLEIDDPEIEGIDQQSTELAEKAYQMLLAWRRKNGSSATYQVLYEALCNELVGCKLLAEEFCCSVDN